ncbi:protein Frey 1 [Microcaecilia unicolor]|uniref:Uncharacterized protein C11orf94 homolog n=1 Tax=Microcaecilia unicolor TaxID=1415580 RepID=A0A6P7XQG5_9AMPH|nr:uncharacterized protein C11orf94 homolog [Microcaecilia unicolor]
MPRFWSLVFFSLLGLEVVFPLPLLQREKRYIPIDFMVPLEIPQKHFGLVDSYGIKPKHPAFRVHEPKHHEEDQEEEETRRRKRDEPDLDEYFYDDVM